uniref:ribosomal protein S12 n=1 Tax=Prosopanche bonacinae TaxID=2952648 RepID=UPI002114C193|nr:ribosomal protein S12 [Prosopanche bonacinae]USN93686.1 ribosomal protein S12 [Prosopanche bonacinae]
MTNIKQIFRKKTRKFNKIITKSSAALKKCPQRLGMCMRLYIIHPKKPNSGSRKVARIRLTSGIEVTALIPGLGINLVQVHSRVLVRGGLVKDLPGVKHKVILGSKDAGRATERFQRRSKYGAKKPKIKN